MHTYSCIAHKSTHSSLSQFNSETLFCQVKVVAAEMVSGQAEQGCCFIELGGKPPSPLKTPILCERGKEKRTVDRGNTDSSSDEKSIPFEFREFSDFIELIKQKRTQPS